MKPLRLTLQAFGPFATTEVIDFRELGDNPLFLIDGATGAGKTTLLDGISYALFGKTTGAERQGEQMRCHHAADDLITEVVFDFAIAGQTYRVQRQPTQERPKLRGEGYKEERASANFWSLTEQQQQLIASRKLQDVNQAVERVIGLRADQFRQVVVLPQGEFRRLLTADATEREAIFAQLFQTQRYQRIEEALKEQAKDIRDAMRQHQQSLDELFNDSGIESEEHLKQQQAKLAPIVKMLAQQKQQCDEQRQTVRAKRQHAEHVIKQFAELNEQRERLQQLDKQLPALQQQQQQLQHARRAQQLQPDYQQLNALSAQQQQNEQQLMELQQLAETRTQHVKEAEQAHQASTELTPKIDKLQQTIRDTERWLPKLEQLTEQRQKLETQQKKRSAQDTKVAELTQQLAKTVRDVETLDEQCRRLQQQVNEHEPVGEQRQRLEYQQQQLNSYQQLEQQLIKTKQQKQQQLSQLENAQQQYQHAQGVSQQLEQQWYQNQAGVLAQTLTADQPCPVCGSSEHPHPAELATHQQVSHQQLRDAREQAQQYQSEQQQQEQAVVRSTQHIESLLQQQQQLPATPSQDDLKRQLAALNQQHDQQQQQRRQLSESQQQLEQLRSQLEQSRRHLDEQQRQLYQSQRDLDLTQQSYQHLAEQIPQQQQDENAIQQSLQQQRQQLKQWQQHQHESQQHLQQVTQDLSVTQAQLKDKQQQAEQLQKQYQQHHQAFVEHVQQHGFADIEAFKQAQLTNTQVEQLEHQINQQQQQRQQCKVLIEQREKQLADQSEPDLRQHDEALAEADKSFAEAERQLQAAQFEQQQLATLEDRLTERKKQAETLQKRYAVTGTLADVASGNNTQRLSLHRFVLSVLLDDVLHVASQRLNKMTQGRYQLLRDTQVTDARSAGGLTLRVEDTYTGQQRSAKTLSGGESFMAALALALGLSDVVQSYAGGIKLDTLFIDEGFGSLDDEALDAAIDVLSELRASGRTIGIISHVRELKERLQQRISVMRHRDGSSIVMRK